MTTSIGNGYVVTSVHDCLDLWVKRVEDDAQFYRWFNKPDNNALTKVALKDVPNYAIKAFINAIKGDRT